MEKLLVDGKLVTPQGIVEGALLIRDGKIAAIGARQDLPKCQEVIDARGNFVLPGVVDPECHLGTRHSFPDEVQTESRAALATGITTWGMMEVVVNTRKEFLVQPRREDHVPWSQVYPVYREICDELSYTDFFLTPALFTDEQVEEIPRLAREYGITSFKMYMHLRSGPEMLSKTWDHAYRVLGFDDGTVFAAMQKISQLGYPGILTLHCENWEIARIFEKSLRAAGRTDMAAWNHRSPHFCEAGHVRTYAYYARMANCPLHIQHVTTPETVKEIETARSEGAVIYGQTGPHYLILSHDQWKINVPLRDSQTNELMWEALAGGRIDSIGSDHIGQPKTKEEMDKGNVWETLSGFPSRVEVLLPALLSEGVNKNRISIEQVARISAENPARIWGLYPKKGSISVGADADLVLVDLNRSMEISRDTIQSAARWSIFEGWKFKGWPIATILRGNVLARWPEGTDRPVVEDQSIGRYVQRVADFKDYRHSWRALVR
jgi:dihydropyrimidinase